MKALRSTNLRIDVFLGGYSRYRQLILGGVSVHYKMPRAK